MSCGPFVLREPVGSGGMGRVWRADDPRRGSTVAVKVISTERAADERYRERFRREVQSHARLRHPGVATVFDYGEIAPKEASASEGRLTAGAPYLALEFAEEGTLDDGEHPSSWYELRRFLIQVLDALAYSHARDVVHRDLKPANVLLFTEGGERRYKLADFGVAYSLTLSRNEGITDLELTVGTPEYMAPEQFEGAWRDFGPWTDLYTLGCLTYRLCCHRYPFDGDTTEEIARDHLHSDLPALQPSFAVPRGFVGWLQQMTAKSPRLRFRRAADAARALADLPELEEPGSAAGLRASTSTVELDDAPDETVDDPEIVEPAPSGPERRDSKTMVPPTEHDASFEETYPEQPGTIIDVPGDDGRDGDTVESAPTMTPSQPFTAPVPGPSMPYLPRDWRVEDARDAAKEKLESGWGLYGLRELPFVDREEERDTLWRLFRRTVDAQGPSAVVVEGRSGRGKSRLAEWMVRRSHEVGGLRVARGSYGRQGGHREGLGEVLDRMMTLWDLDRTELIERTREKLGVWYPPECGDAYLDREARAVAHFLEPGSGDAPGPNYYFDDAEEKFALLVRILRAYARDRPVVVWLDDVQWGPMGLDFAKYFLESEEADRVCLILTARTEALEQRPVVRERIDQITGFDSVDSMELGPLDDEDHAELLRRLLPLEDQLVDEMARRTAGNPLFAVQLVGDLVDRGKLEERGNRLGLGEEGHRELKNLLPGHLSELWQRRVDRVARVVAEDGENAPDRGDAQQAIELAAAFGEQVDQDEWELACERAGVEIPRRLVDELVVRGLARREPNGWQFAHGMLVDAIAGNASDAGRLRRAHRICADVIAEMYAEDRRDAVFRRAEHLMSAAAWEEALEPLLTAARMSRRAGRYHRCRQLLEQRAEVIERLGLGAESRHRVEQWVVEARVQVLGGGSEEAEQLGQRARRVAERNDWHRLAGEALEFLSFHRKLQGQIDETMQLAEEAQEAYERIGAERKWAMCEMERAHAHQCRSEYVEAREALEEAEATFRRHDAPHREMRATKRLIYCLIYEERYDEARRRAHRLRERADEHGNASVEAHGWNQLGEIARFREKWARAREYYETAFDIWERTGSDDRKVVAINIAFVEMAAGSVEEAAEAFRHLDETFRASGWSRMLPNVTLGLAVCRARQRDWAAWEEALEAAHAALDRVENRERDHGWLAEHLVDSIDPDAHPDRYGEARELAERIWRELGGD